MTSGVSAKGKVKFDYVPQDQLEFDPTNPRFSSISKGVSQPQIQAVLEKEPHFALELIPSFLENGYIAYEPLVVRAEGEKFKVVEGNRRLAAIRHILSKRSDYEKKSPRVASLEKIPVLVFPDAASEDHETVQRVYLGVRHLFGFREWPPESKARYLDAQIKSAADLDRIMRELNIKRQDIQRYLIPFRLRKQAKDLWEPHQDQDFWVLGEGLNRSGIKGYIQLDVDRNSMKVKDFDRDKLKHLLTFIYGTPKERKDRIIKETRELSLLATLLQSKRAATALEKGKSPAEAAVMIESADETRRRLKTLLREFQTVLARFRSRSDAAPMRRAFASFATACKGFLRKDVS